MNKEIKKLQDKYSFLNETKRANVDDILRMLNHYLNDSSAISDMKQILQKKFKYSDHDNSIKEFNILKIRNDIVHNKNISEELKVKLEPKIWEMLPHLNALNNIQELQNFLSYIFNLELGPKTKKTKKSLTEQYLSYYKKLKPPEKDKIFYLLATRVLLLASKEELLNYFDNK